MCNCLTVHQILSRVLFLDIFCILAVFSDKNITCPILCLLVCSSFLRNNVQKHSFFLKVSFGDLLVTLNKETVFSWTVKWVKLTLVSSCSSWYKYYIHIIEMYVLCYCWSVCTSDFRERWLTIFSCYFYSVSLFFNQNTHFFVLNKIIFVRLPDELLVTIFKYLGPSELLTCAQVCHKWSAVSKER